MRRFPTLATMATVATVALGTSAAYGATLSVNDGTLDAAPCNVAPDHSTIQAAINAAAASGDTVNVCPGTYAENVVLNKSITLNGAQAGVDARGRSASESTIAPAGGIALELRTGSAASVIDGFTLSGGARGIESTSGPLDQLRILNNRVVAFTNNGLFMNNPGVDITVDQNAVDAASKTGGGGLVHFDTDAFPGLHFTNNDVQGYLGVGTGFFVDGNHNVGASVNRGPLFDGNRLDGAGTGANLGSRAFGFGTISDNTFSNNAFDGLQGGIQDSTVSGNVFSDNGRHGLALTSFGSLAIDRGGQRTMVLGNEVSGNGFAQAGAGLLFSAGQAAGTISTNQAHQNNITGNNIGAQYTGIESVNADCNWWGNFDGPSGTGPGGGDSVVGLGLTFTPWLTAPAPGGPCNGPLSSMEHKQAVRDQLADMLPTGDAHDDHEIAKALEHIDKSLEPELWVDDEHLDAKHGKKVFDEERAAVKHLEKVDTVDVSSQIGGLVGIDHDLAETAIDDANAATVMNPKNAAKVAAAIDKAEAELAKGDAETDPDKAIEHYGKAWEHAQKAIKEAAKP